jgi:glycosyltransferase involved in cell wall biosynthesis
VKVSIVTISFNQASFLGRNLESVRAQDHDDWEHILVDPGSTDGSRELISAAAARDPRVVTIFEPDSGPADGLNAGLARARGEIFAYLNADDEFAPGALSRIVAAHEARPDAQVVVGDGWWIDAGDAPVGYLRSDRFTPRRWALKVGVLVQQATSYKRPALSGLRFNTDNPINWDAEFALDAYRAGLRFCNLPHPLGYFRQHDDSLSVSGRRREDYRREWARLRSAAIPGVPSVVLDAISWAARAVKAVRNRVWLAVTRPRFPGLAREVSVR